MIPTYREHLKSLNSQVLLEKPEMVEKEGTTTYAHHFGLLLELRQTES